MNGDVELGEAGECIQRLGGASTKHTHLHKDSVKIFNVHVLTLFVQEGA